MVGDHVIGFGIRMNHNDKNGVRQAILLAALMAPAGAIAQTVPVPQDGARTIPGLVVPAPTPVPTPTGPVPGLPAPLPAPAPTASATPEIERTRRATARPAVPASAPTDEPAARVSAVAPAAINTPTPVASSALVVVPTPLPSPTIAPPPAATANAGVVVWPWLVVGAAALLALAGWLWWRRRSVVLVDPRVPEDEPLPPPAPAPIAAPVRPSGSHARIGIALRPIRAGLNMLSATVEAEVVVTNTGDAHAAQVRVHATLLSAHAAQDADIAAVFAGPAGRPAAAPFALAPGDERRVRIVAALPREAVRSMEAGGRPMFVPLMVIDIRYAADEAATPARAGQAFVIGIERVDSAKLAPFWLDGPSRMHGQIAARAHGGMLIG